VGVINLADFLKSYQRTCNHEGKYANHPNDKGGETWKGIARNYHPRWKGWPIVDEYKQKYQSVKELNKALSLDVKLEDYVESFYKVNFWDINRLSELNSQLVAENVFDCSVNCGTGTGARILQKAINGTGQYSLSVDGVIGGKTLTVANWLNDALVNPYVDLRIQYHKDIVTRNSSQKVFLKGWLARCESMRKTV
jgi:lysozyme family protein